MTTFTFTQAWQSEVFRMAFRGASPPDPSKFRMCLSTMTLTSASTTADFIASELSPTNGYARQTVTFSSDGLYNPTSKRHEMPPISAQFTASGGNLQFQSAFLLADAITTASLEFDSTEVNAVTNRIIITNHGYSNGTQLLFTADTLATLPEGIETGVIYQTANVTINDFQLQPVGGGASVDVTNIGSGSFRARSVGRIIVGFMTESSLITLSDGQPYISTISLISTNVGYINGV